MLFCIKLYTIYTMNLGDFLNTLAVNSGIATDSAELKALLSNTTIAGYEIPDGIVSKIQSSHLTLDAAKNNTAVISHIKAQLYNGVDSELNSTLNELGVYDNLKADFDNEKSTPKRMSLALKKIAALEKEKSGAGKGDKDLLQAEINKLNSSIVDLKKNFDNEKLSLVSKHQDEILDYDLGNVLSAYNYALPKEMAADLKIQTAKMILNKSLKEKDAKIVRENGALKLKRASQDIDYFDESNQKVDHKKFIDGVLAQNNLLAVTPAKQQTPSFTTPGEGEGKAQTTKSWDDASAESLSQVKVA